jgi:hypothetical protein
VKNPAQFWVKINTLDLRTSGLITATVTTVTGTAAAVATAYASAGITGLGNEAVTLSGTTAAAATLNAIDLRTTGLINAYTVTTVTGTAADIATAFGSSGISGLSNKAVTLSDTTAAATTLNSLDGRTNGVVNAATVLTVTGTAVDVAKAYASGGITGLGNEAVTLSGTTAAAATLNAIDLRTSGSIDAATVTTVTGTAADVATAYASAGITGLGNEAVTLSGTTATAADLNAINSATTGNVSLGTVLTVTGELAELTTMYLAAGFKDRGNEAMTLSDTTVVVTGLMVLDGLTTGVVNASSVTSLSGSWSTISTAFASAGITGLGNAALIVTGSVGNDTIVARSNDDTINGGAGADVLTGGLGNDTFVFVAGQGNGDRIADFTGLGGTGDSLEFGGYGVGATFTDQGSGVFEIASQDRSVIDVITIVGGGVTVNDWTFV